MRPVLAFIISVLVMLAVSALSQPMPALAPAAPVETNKPLYVEFSWQGGTNGAANASFNVFTNGTPLANTVLTHYKVAAVSLPFTFQVQGVSASGATSALSAAIRYPQPVTNVWRITARASTSLPTNVQTGGVVFTNWPAMSVTNIDGVTLSNNAPQFIWVVGERL